MIIIFLVSAADRASYSPPPRIWVMQKFQISSEHFLELKQFLENDWVQIPCARPKHRTYLSKICLDARCCPQTEQFRLICDKCIQESRSHCSETASHAHATIDLDQAVIDVAQQVINTEFQFQKTLSSQPQYSQLLKMRSQIAATHRRLTQLLEKIQENLKFMQSVQTHLDKVLLDLEHYKKE